jgi:hypothetical protein
MKTDDTALPPPGSGDAAVTGPAVIGPAGPRSAGPGSGDAAAAGVTTDLGAGPGHTDPWERPPALPFRAAFGVRDLRAAGVVALGAAVLGVPVGAIWAALAPHSSVTVTIEGAVIADHRQEAFIGADATFAGIAVVTGLLLGIAAYLWRRRRGPWMAIGLAVGGIAGSLVAWWVGHRFGLSDYRALIAQEPGGPPFDRPVDLDATGALFLQPLVAVIVYVLAAGWSRFADLGRIAPDPAAVPLPGDAASPVSSGSAVPEALPAGPAPPPTGGASSPPA